MKKVIPECGLMIKLSELYELIQGNMDDNFTGFVKSVILEPGLRIAEGDEFLVHQVGENLMIKMGGVVFPNWDIFLPSESATDLIIDVSGIEGINEPGTVFSVWLVLEEAASHPQRKMDTYQLFRTVQQNVVKAYLYPENYAPPAGMVSYLLTMVTVQEDGVLEFTDKRFDSILKLVSRYAHEDWEAADIASVVEKVEANFLLLEDYRQASVGGYPINKQSLAINRRLGPVLEVFWPAPLQSELDAVGGIVYYKVIAVPDVSPATLTLIEWGSLSQIVMVDRIGIEELNSERIGCIMNCELGVNYSITVHRISNILDMQISAASDPVIVKAGAPETSSTACQSISSGISYAFMTSDFIKINYDIAPSPDTIARIFIREYSGTPYTGEELNDLKYLAYEGAIQEVIYRVQDKTNTGISVLYQIMGKLSNFISCLLYDDFEFSTQTPDDEMVMVFRIPEIANGWPIEPPSAQAAGINYEVAYGAASFNISGFSPAMLPHNRIVGDWVYVDFLTGPSAALDAWCEITAVTDNMITFSALVGMNSGDVGTCTIFGNISILNATNPVVLQYPASSPLEDVFVVGDTLVVDNTTNAAALPNGTYDITALNASANRISVDYNGVAGVGYCDITPPSPQTLHEFTLGKDVALSRIKVSNYEGQALNDEAAMSGWAAKYIVDFGAIPTVAGELNVPRSGSGYIVLEDNDAIPAGDTISIKLERGADTLKGINASDYLIFLYFKRTV